MLKYFFFEGLDLDLDQMKQELSFLIKIEKKKNNLFIKINKIIV